MTTKTRSRVLHSSTVEACCHIIDFWYERCGHKLTDDMREDLESHAEERAREMIANDYCCGELNCLYTLPNWTDLEIRGYWTIREE